MKKILGMISAALMLSAAGSVFAADEVQCPNALTVRANGTTLTRAYMDTQVKDYLWYFYSQPFSSSDTGFLLWQTIFEENLPGITNPSLALVQAQEDLNSLALSTYSAKYTTNDGVTVCEYQPSNSNYRVFAVNHVDVAFKRLK